MNIDTDLLLQAIQKWGKEAQIDKIQEEAQELALALHQVKCLTKENEEGMSKIYGELADMQIVMEYVPLLFNQNKIDRIKQMKLNILKQLLQ